MIIKAHLGKIYPVPKDNDDKIVALDTSLLSNYIYIRNYIGSPKQSVLEIMNLRIEYMWTVDRYYLHKSSTTAEILQNSIIDYKGEQLDAYDIKDYFQFNDNFNITLVFKYAHKYEKHEKDIGGIGFGFNENNINKPYSLLYQLKDKGIIDRLVFGLVWKLYQSVGVIYLGGIPSQIIGYKQKGICKTRTKDGKMIWGCKLHRVRFDNKTQLSYVNDYPSTFKTNSDIINVPLDFFKFLTEKVIRKKQCALHSDKEINFIKCDYDILNKLPNISFVFGNTELTLSIKQMSYAQEGQYILLLQNKKNQNSKWVFGCPFITLFTMLFDYDNKEIVFYNDEGISHLSEFEEQKINQNENSNNNVIRNMNKIIIRISLIASSFLFFGLIILYTSYFLFIKRPR